MGKYLNKIKNILLTIFGILFIVELVRRFKSGESTEVDVEDIKDRIKQGEQALQEIENAKPDVDSIIDEWNSK